MDSAIPGAGQLTRLRRSHKRQIEAMCDAARPHLESGFFIRPQKQIGGDSMFLRRFLSESNPNSGDRTHYYWLHHWDVSGKDYSAYALSQRLESQIQDHLDLAAPSARGRFNPAGFIRGVVRDLHASNGVDLKGPGRIPEKFRSVSGHLGIVAVSERTGKPDGTRFYHVNFGAPAAILHERSPDGAASGRYLCEGAGAHPSNILLLMQDPSSVKIGVHSLLPGHTIFFYGDGMMQKYGGDPADVLDIVQSWVGGSPDAAIAYLKKKCMPVIRSNHDDASAFAVHVPRR